MAQLLGKKRGRPLKHENGWEGANKRICISNTTFMLWRNIRKELGLLNDDALAIHLIGLHNKRDADPVLNK